MPHNLEQAETIFRGRQFSVRSLFVATTLVALIYAGLNLFGITAHIVVWGSCLVLGTVLGFWLALKRPRESDPIVNGVQSAALGGLSGFVLAFVLLAPANFHYHREAFPYVAVLGSGGAFAVSGLVGFCAGGVRWMLRCMRTFLRWCFGP